MENSILSLLPPVLALTMVIFTRRVLLSLGVGIVIGSLMINSYQPLDTFKQIFSVVGNIFVVDGDLNTWELYILFFLLILGMISSLISITGGSRAFGEWAMEKVKSRVGAQLVTFFLGVIIFIDDYFNSLVVGNVSQPLTDRYNISRSKLAYIVDSTSAPICIIAPISSWGAYIITIIGGILVNHGVTQYEALTAFLLMIPMNYYAILAILMVIAVVIFKLDIGLMKKHEELAINSNGMDKYNSKELVDSERTIKALESGKVGDLLWPIITLVIGTIFFMFLTGIQASQGEINLIAIFENTDVATALVYGGLLGLLVSVVLLLAKRIPFSDFRIGLWNGIKSMLPAIYILLFSWTLIEIIRELGTGPYLASFVNQYLNIAYLPVLLFIIAAVMAFSTGSSWGTFAILLPIAGEIAALSDISLILPILAAVLAGSIFGDHCSPISDTTILSSTGAGCNHIDHVITQLPYALIIAVITAVGYMVLGVSGSVMLGLVVSIFILIAVIFIIKRINVVKSNTTQNMHKVEK
ncbi:Na+/H+ antiporter NhaC family protein [Alkalihalobacillus sp. BA299]|uniref:Na+/H+ antiporter NhaC family protein n=1 Tax=Alkalihalobacillus sp. BA299 TaxID=2815938 RepID=UPI001ADC09F6|nr:Na+/H+ antiporter NhaC family protein [Alkalihalobacillus sp. BA299]